MTAESLLCKLYKTVVKYWTLTWTINFAMQIKLPHLQWLSMEKVQVSCITSPVQWQQCKTGISTVLAMEIIQGYGVSSPLAIYTHLCTFFFFFFYKMEHCGIFV